MLWREGDGKTIRVFEDRWLPGQNPSKVISPWMGIDDDWTVSQLIDQDMGWWNSSIIDALFLPFEDRKSTRLNSSHLARSRMPSSA